MKTPSSWIAVLALALALAFPAGAAEVLSDSGFGSVQSGPRGWRLSQGSTTYKVVIDDFGQRGKCIEAFEPEPGGSLGRLFEDVGARVIPGQTYRLTGWIKTQGVTSSDGVVIGVGTVDAQYALIPGSFQKEIGRVKGTTDWKFFDSGDFVLPPLTPGTVTHAVYLDFNGNGGGRARFDDVSLSGPVAPSAFSLLDLIAKADARIIAMILIATLTLAAGGAAVWALRRFEAPASDWVDLAGPKPDVRRERSIDPES